MKNLLFIPVVLLLFVFNAQGQLVLEKEVDPGSEGILTRVDLTNQESGMYFLSIEQGGKENVSRIVKH
jgi:hypothetical protein